MFSTLGIFSFAAALTSVLAVTVGGFEDGGDTLVSAMMMFLGNEDSIYILDKVEGNAAQIGGHPAWASLWDVNTRRSIQMDTLSNPFCASGMHLPNGSFVTFGGNSAVSRNGAQGSQTYPDGQGSWDDFYRNSDGRRSIRIVNPCKITDSLTSSNCKWFDDPERLSMKRRRWYSTAEPTADGQIVIIGGFVNGGYINRETPNVDPAFEGGLAEPTYEYFPPKDGEPEIVDFVVNTSGLNSYPHTFLMPSGRMLLQANLSTALWDHVANTEVPLPDMPNGVIRVYPASGATAMLPLTPSNNYTPTILFCGGNTMTDAQWGDYAGPDVDTWNVLASRDCQRLTPEPIDGSPPRYEVDDEMLEPRAMSQFIILPNGKLLMLNGVQRGTGGYAPFTRNTTEPNMPFGQSLATDPVLTPVIYDPNAPKGSRWSNQGLLPSRIPRLYHSSAMLLPDGSVIAAGSNPNSDVNLTTVYPTEYRADIFFPSYFSASVRPSPQNLPSTLSYGGPYFNITIPSSSYSGNVNDSADATTVVIVRGGFTTHAMNMGQRFMQLNNTYTVKRDGSIILHVSQLPPNANLFQPGPALLFVNINGIPSTGKYVIIGNGNIGPQPTSPASQLPQRVRFDNTAPSDTPTQKPKVNKTVIGGVVAAIVCLAVIATIAGVSIARRRRTESLSEKSALVVEESKPVTPRTTGPRGFHFFRSNSAADSSILAPLANRRGLGDGSEAWESRLSNLTPDVPFKDDDMTSSPARDSPLWVEYNPYHEFSGLSQHTSREDTTSSPARHRPLWNEYNPFNEFSGVPQQFSDSVFNVQSELGSVGFGGDSPSSGQQTPADRDA